MKRKDYSLRGTKNTVIRNVKTAAKGSRIENHAWSHDHIIDFNNASFIDKGNQSRIRKCLESWHTTITPDADNNSCRHSQHNIAFLLTKILNVLTLYSSLILLYCFLVLSHIIFLEFLLFFITSPVEDRQFRRSKACVF